MSRSAGRLGWYLVWAVAFCDVGGSVYYAPGLARGVSGAGAGVFVLATVAVFGLLAAKALETIRRFPAGGGVVSLAHAALGPWGGALAGLLAMTDLFLTVALCALTAVHYLDSLGPMGASAVPLAVACLLLLGVLNTIGVKESARVGLGIALGAFVVDALVIVGTVVRSPDRVTSAVGAAWTELATLPPSAWWVGYAGAWFAFSGLESVTQLAPALRDLGPTPRRGLVAVVASALLVVPPLALLATGPGSPDDGSSERLMAALAGAAGGSLLEAATLLVAVSLLLLAANTAVAGNYHVQLALTARDFLPESLGTLSRRFQTPSRAIVLGTVVPAVVLVVVGGRVERLGELFGFGLLGSFLVGGIALDVLRWRDGDRGLRFWVGLLTTVCVAAAFVGNLIARPGSVVFGGVVVGVGALVGVGTRGGWFARVLGRLPGLRPPEIVARAEVPVRTLTQARAAVVEGDPPGILVASRGATLKIFREATDRARARGLSRVFLLYVDEVPGLFYPQLASPTPEGLTVLESGCSMIRSLGLEPIPVWTLSHSAATSVSEAADACRCDTIVIGATQRTVLWHALRGRFIQELLRQLPSEIRLIVVG